MSSVFRKRGFDAHKTEEKRREKEKDSRTGKLWGFFLKDGEEDVPLRFLTEEPILFYEHTVNLPGGKFSNATCEGDDCEYCASGDKPSYKGAWLVVDGREVEIDEKKDGKATGKKKTIKDQIRIYKRGTTDIAKLDRLSRKWGLTSRPWFATKTGSGTSTSYELDRGEESELSVKEITNLLSKTPDKFKNHYNGDEEELYDIVEANIFDDIELGDSEEEEKPSKKSKGRRIEEEDEDEDDDDDDDIESGVKSIKKKKKSGLKAKSKSKPAVKKKSAKKVFKRA